jgi:hypothetical protein
MKTQIKTQMKTNLKALFFITICALFFSCESKIHADADSEIVDETTVTEDGSMVTGTLLYNGIQERWEIHDYIEGTFDSIDVYVVTNYTVTIPTDSYQKVKAVGSFYESEEKSPWAGTTIYIIEVEQLIFE